MSPYNVTNTVDSTYTRVSSSVRKVWRVRPRAVRAGIRVYLGTVRNIRYISSRCAVSGRARYGDLKHCSRRCALGITPEVSQES